MADLNIDDGGGESFSSGYDASPLVLTIPKDSIINMPKAVGYWSISGNFQVSGTEKPNWFHRKMTKLLLGWIWVDS